MINILILVHDGLQYLKECVVSLRKDLYKSGIADSDRRIIVIDNSSEKEETKKYFEWLKITKGFEIFTTDKNYNFSKAHNLAIKALNIEGDIVLLNSDVFPAGWSLKELLACKDRHPEAGIIGTKLLRHNAEQTIYHCGVVFGDNKIPYHRFHNVGRFVPRSEIEEQIQAVTFAYAYITEKCWAALGGLTEPESDAFEYWYEDIDFCLRARAQGFEIWQCPKALALHVGSATTKETLEGQTQSEISKFCFKHSAEFVEKHKDEIIVDYKEMEKMPEGRPKIVIGTPMVEKHSWCRDMFLDSMQRIEYWKKDIVLAFPVNNSGQRYWRDLYEWGRAYISDQFAQLMLPQKINNNENKNESVVFGRNLCVNTALNLDADYLWFIDCDVICPKDALKKLLALDADIAVAPVLYKGGDPRPMILKYRPGFNQEKFDADLLAAKEIYEIDDVTAANPMEYQMGPFEIDKAILEEKEPRQVAAAGLGCALIKKKVFEQIKFEAGVKGYNTEDIWFFERANRAGFKTVCDPTIKVFHLDRGAVY